MQLHRDKRLLAAVQAGLITRPQPILEKLSCPFRSAMCLIEPRPGCLPPPNGAARRIAVGRGATAEEAACLAMAEAVERYSIQYGTALPNAVHPFRTWGGPACPATIDELTIGAPGRRTNSTGSAAGATLDDAARRAVLELLEHRHAAEVGLPSSAFFEIDPASVPSIGPHVAWLSGQLRILRCQGAAFVDGYAFAAVACSDRDGARRTEGTAAGPSLAEAVRHAAEEAIFSWRNMVALEQNAALATGMAPEERAAIEAYRGWSPRRAWPTRPPAPPGLAEFAGDPVLDDLLAALARRVGRVRLFDLTDASIGLPVVRALPG